LGADCSAAERAEGATQALPNFQTKNGFQFPNKKWFSFVVQIFFLWIVSQRESCCVPFVEPNVEKTEFGEQQMPCGRRATIRHCAFWTTTQHSTLGVIMRTIVMFVVVVEGRKCRMICVPPSFVIHSSWLWLFQFFHLEKSIRQPSALVAAAMTSQSLPGGKMKPRSLVASFSIAAFSS